MLSFSDVSLGSVLCGLSFEINRQSLCIVSENEAEANAVADILCAVAFPDSGKADIRFPVPLLAKDAPLPPYLKCSDYPKTVGNGEIAAYACELSKGMADKYISSLSRFERVRLGILSLTETSGDYFFAEYPTDGLEPESSALILDLMHDPEHGKTPIFTSKSLRDVQSSELVLVVSKGRAEFFGTPDALTETADAPGTLIAKIMGNEDKIKNVFEALDIKVREGDKQNLYEVSFPEGLSSGTIKEMLKGTGLVFISARKDNDTLKSIVASLRRTDELKDEKAEQEKKSKAGPAKLDASLFAFSRTENAFEPNEDGDEDDGEAEESSGFDAESLFGNSESSEEEYEEDEESTIFGHKNN